MADPLASGASARFLALDVGSVRVGVALSDPSGTFAQPLAVLGRWPRPREPSIGARLSAWARTYEVRALVVGRPLSLSGAEGPATRTVEAFVAGLGASVDLAVVWWDERLSTRQAERALIAGGMRRQQRRQEIDQVAAALILQAFLDARRAAHRRGEAAPGDEAAPGNEAGPGHTAAPSDEAGPGHTAASGDEAGPGHTAASGDEAGLGHTAAPGDGGAMAFGGPTGRDRAQPPV